MAISNPVDIGGALSAVAVASIAITVPAGGVPAGARIFVDLYTSHATVPAALAAVDSKGNTYSLDESLADGTSQMLATFSANAGTALVSGDTITVSWTGNTTRVAARASYAAGVATSGALDSHNNISQAAATSMTGAAVTTIAANTIVRGTFGISLGGSASSGFTAGAGYTAGTEENVGAGSTNRAVDSEYQIVSANGTYTPTATQTNSKAFLAITTVYAAAGGAPPPPAGTPRPETQVRVEENLLGKVRIIVERPGSSVLDITSRVLGNCEWTTVAVGGFGSATLRLDGVHFLDVPHLSRVTITFDQKVLFQGYVEKPKTSLAAGAWQTVFQAWGPQRALTNASVRRGWLARSGLDFTQTNAVLGMTGQSGQLDPANPTILGVGFLTDGSAVSSGAVCTMLHRTPKGLPVVRILGNYVTSLSVRANWTARIAVANADTSQRTNVISLATPAASGSFDTATVAYPLLAAPEGVIFELLSSASQTPTQNEYVRFYNLRFLYSMVAEDAAGAVYGGTVLRDLLTLVPGLYPGLIEAGSEFAIPEIERRVRSAALSVVQEVAGYYEKEWAVWEDGRFDWRQPLLDAPQWVCTVSDIVSMDMQSDVDGTMLTSIVTYTDPSDGREKEASVASTDPRNPFVRTATAKDGVHVAQTGLTETTAALLAAKLSADEGARPQVAGSIVLNANAMLARADGMRAPAFTIRAGENIRIADLPFSSAYGAGRDGETLFHIVSTSTSGLTLQITLELEGMQTRADVLLARLAAATRTVTG